MKKSRPNLVAGRLSHPLAASGKSTYEKTRLGLTPGHVPDSADDATQDYLPPVDAPPVDPPTTPPTHDAPHDALDTITTQGPFAPPDKVSPAPWELPIAPADEPDTPWELPPTPPDAPATTNDHAHSDAPTLQPWELPLAPVETETPNATPEPAPTTANTLTLQPWELPPAPPEIEAPNTTPEPAPLAASTPTSILADMHAQVRAQAIQAWNAQQQPKSELATPAPARSQQGIKVLHIVKVVWPALGGLVLLAVMYGLWVWVNGGSPWDLIPRSVIAAPAKRPTKNVAATAETPATALIGQTSVVTPQPSDEPSLADVKIPDNWMENGFAIEFPDVPEPDPTPTTTAPADPVTTAPVDPTSITRREPPPTLKLVSIGRMSKGPAATINGRVRYVGDVVDGATVIAIGKFSVEMKLGSERFMLHLGKGEESSDEAPPEAPAEPTPTPASAPATPE